MVNARAGGFVIIEDRFLFGFRRGITDLALKHRLPAVYAQTGFIEADGLAVYAPNIYHTPCSCSALIGSLNDRETIGVARGGRMSGGHHRAQQDAADSV
jgi:hypothetical protein